MKFKYYITEQDDKEKTIQDIKKNCSQIISQYKRKIERDTFDILYREENKNISYILKTVRKDRTPLDTPQWLHEIFDNSFKKYFNKPLRSQSLFAERRIITKLYSKGFFIVFPFNGYRLIQSDLIEDLFRIYTSSSELRRIFRIGKSEELKFYELLKEVGIRNNTIKGAMEEFSKLDVSYINKLKHIIQSLSDKIAKTYRSTKEYKELEYHNEVMIDCDKAYLIGEEEMARKIILDS